MNKQDQFKTGDPGVDTTRVVSSLAQWELNVQIIFQIAEKAQRIF